MELIKKVQPVPKYIRPEKGDKKDGSSEDGNKPTSNEPEKPFADLQLVYTSCKDAVLRLDSSANHSKETVQPWLKIIDDKLAGINKLRKEEGDASRQGATQETVLSRPGPGFDRANHDRKTMNQEVRRLRQLCSGVLLEIERDPNLVARKCTVDESRDETYEEFIKQTLMKGYDVYVDAHNRLREQQRTSPDEQKEVNPKPSKKKKKGRWSRKKGQ